MPHEGHREPGQVLVKDRRQGEWTVCRHCRHSRQPQESNHINSTATYKLGGVLLEIFDLRSCVFHVWVEWNNHLIRLEFKHGAYS